MNPWKEGSVMRIEAYTQVQQLYKTNKVKKTNSVSRASGKDQVEISTFGKDIQTAKAALSATPDIREDVTSLLKTSINSGNYSVSDESFAEKLLSKYNA